MRIRIVGLLVALSVLPFIADAQLKGQHLPELYKFVDQTDSLSLKNHKTFYLEKFLDDNFNYREQWRYAEHNGRIVYFQVDYILDSTEFTEVYYVNKGNLICSEEYEKVNYSMMEDALRRGGVYYFHGPVPEHTVMLGVADRSRYSAPPQTLVLERFHKRYTELRRHLPMLPRY